MSLARILSRSPQASNLLARTLRARGFEIEAPTNGAHSTTPADVEFSVEECIVEDALEQAGRAAGKCVFIATGALSDGLAPLAAVPLVAEESEEAPLDPVAAPPVSRESGSGAPVFELAAAKANEPASIPVAEIESHPQEALVLASTTAATISDLAPHTEISDSGEMNGLIPIPQESCETPSSEEVLPPFAATLSVSAEEPAAVVELPQEEVLPPTEPSSAASEPPIQIVPDDFEQSPAVIEVSPPMQALFDSPASPEPELMAEPVQAEPIVLEKTPALLEKTPAEQTAVVAPAAKAAPRRIRILLPGFRKHAHLWGFAALVFVVGLVALVRFSTKPVAPSVNVVAPKTNVSPAQTSSQNKNASAAAPAVNAPTKAQAASPAPRRHSVSQVDEGYIAKDTVVRYGNSSPPPAKKAKIQPGSHQ